MANRPPLPLRLLRNRLPAADRDEIVDGLLREYTARAHAAPVRARLWLWRQGLGSIAPLTSRAWRRGWTGWESESNRLQPGGTVLENVIIDVRFAVRRLVKRPMWAATAVLTLALGVGGTAAVFGLVRTLLLDPLPYAQSEDLVEFWMTFSWSQAEYLALLDAAPEGLGGLAAYRDMDVTHAPGGGPARLLQGIGASATVFDVLGVHPQLGSGFDAGADATGSPPVVMLSHGLWQELGGDPDIVGSALVLGGVSRTVVGVMPRGFWFPDPSVRVWMPVALNPNNRSGLYTFIARVPGGEDGVAAGAAVSGVTRILDEHFDYPPAWDKLAAPALRSMREALVGEVRPVLLSTLAAMVVILLMAIANVAALMLGQVDARSTELAVRRALGAGRPQIARQLLAEAGAVGLAAAVAGAAVAATTFGVLTRALPLGALGERATLDWATFFAALAFALLAALLVALVPLVAIRRVNVAGVLAGARTSGIAGRGGRLESGLVIAEVALAVLMAAGASLLLRSVANLRAIEPGLDVEGLAVIDVVAGAELDAEGRRRMLREVVPALEAMPGAGRAAATQKLPLRGSGDNWGITVRGVSAEEVTTTAYRIVTAGYFDAIGQRLLAGRTFTGADANGETVVVINRSLADRYFAGEDALDRYIGSGYDTTWARIIGVVDDAADAALTDPAAPSRYMLVDQLPFAPQAWSLVVRTGRGRDAADVAADARAVVNRVAPSVAVQTTTTMDDVFDQAMGPARQLMGLLLLLAALAITLGAVGVYGVVSHFVTRRRRDWSIRIALGLRPRRLVAGIVGRGSALVVGGAIIGLSSSVIVLRVIAGFLYGVGSADPAALALATGVLIAIGAAASLIPAVRASRADPASVLRET